MPTANGASARTSSTLSLSAACAGMRSRCRSWKAPMRNAICTGAVSFTSGRCRNGLKPASSAICQRNTPNTSVVARLRSAGESAFRCRPCNSSSLCPRPWPTSPRISKAAARAGLIRTVDFAAAGFAFSAPGFAFAPPLDGLMPGPPGLGLPPCLGFSLGPLDPCFTSANSFTLPYLKITPEIRS